MAKEAGQDINKDNREETSKSYENSRNKLQTAAYIGVIALIISVVLIMSKLYLFAGTLIIIVAILAMYLIRKTIRNMDKVKDSLMDVSSSNDRKVDVITDFSHRIREPLNNIVIITEMLMESGLQKKQKELLETFVASTKEHGHKCQ